MQDDQNQPGWVFNPGDQQAQARQPELTPLSAEPGATSTPPYASDAPQISWTASEYVANPKSAGWFSLLAVASIALAVAVYLVTSDVISAVVVVVVGLALGIFSARQPRVLEYSIDNFGLRVGEKAYPYDTFRSFSVGNDQAVSYIQLMPLRRFMPPLTIHYDPADEEKIANTLSDHLPFEEHKPDMVDNLSRRFRL